MKAFSVTECDVFLRSRLASAEPYPQIRDFYKMHEKLVPGRTSFDFSSI